MGEISCSTCFSSGEFLEAGGCSCPGFFEASSLNGSLEGMPLSGGRCLTAAWLSLQLDAWPEPCCMPARIFPTPQDKVRHTTFPLLPVWWGFNLLFLSTTPGFSVSKHRQTHFAASFYFFLAAKAQKSVTGTTMKKCHDVLKILGRKEAKEAKSLQVAARLCTRCSREMYIAHQNISEKDYRESQHTKEQIKGDY